MSKIKFLNYKNVLLNKKKIYCKTGKSILDLALKNKIFIEHACEKSCSCSTCHCIIIKGMEALSNKKEEEDDVLDKAWNVKYNSRLSCQAKIKNKKINIIVKIPLYNKNQK